MTRQFVLVGANGVVPLSPAEERTHRARINVDQADTRPELPFHPDFAEELARQWRAWVRDPQAKAPHPARYRLAMMRAGYDAWENIKNNRKTS